MAPEELRELRRLAHWYVREAARARFFWDTEDLLDWLRKDAGHILPRNLAPYRRALRVLDERGELFHLVALVAWNV